MNDDGSSRPSDEISVPIQDSAWTDALPDAEALVTRAARAALAAGDAPAPAAVAVALADDAAVRRLNFTYRGQDKPTNVLSFPDGETDPEGTTALGDLILAYGTVAREAAEQGKPLADHLRHLTVHGVLHLLGWDHETEAEAEAMERLERRILAGFGVPDPYAPTPCAPEREAAAP
jgi:probable rRNA maturation factor